MYLGSKHASVIVNVNVNIGMVLIPFENILIKYH
jgi:hypothetical protein